VDGELVVTATATVADKAPRCADCPPCAPTSAWYSRAQPFPHMTALDNVSWVCAGAQLPEPMRGSGRSWLERVGRRTSSLRIRRSFPGPAERVAHRPGVAMEPKECSSTSDFRPDPELVGGSPRGDGRPGTQRHDHAGVTHEMRFARENSRSHSSSWTRGWSSNKHAAATIRDPQSDRLKSFSAILPRQGRSFAAGTAHNPDAPGQESPPDDA